MYRSRIFLTLIVLTLYAIGCVVIFSTSSAEVLDQQLDLSTYHAVIRQLVYGLLGLGLALFVYRVGHRVFLQISPVLLVVFIFMLLLVLITGIGREVNGSKRWLAIGGLSFQPSEFVKYVLIAFFIHEFSQLRESEQLLKSFIKTLAKCLIPLFLILIEPNNGTVAVMALSLVVTFILMKVPFLYWGVPLLACVLLGGVFATQLPYVQGRLKVYMNPELDIHGRGHQPYQAKIAVGSGGLTGKGPGMSLQKLSYLPEAQNDYIAAIIGEEYGFLGMLVVITLYASLAAIGCYIACFTPHETSSYLAISIIFLISFQAFMNLAVVSGLLPSTGLNLPFVSQGGTSLMANLFGVGLLMSIAKEIDNSLNYKKAQTTKG
ncbi:MAG: putative lipid II flippase FtsW [Chlamydiota bacterium]